MKVEVKVEVKVKVKVEVIIKSRKTRVIVSSFFVIEMTFSLCCDLPR